MVQLHLGAMTVRVTQDALAELFGTLGEALAANALRTAAGATRPYPTRARGKA